MTRSTKSLIIALRRSAYLFTAMGMLFAASSGVAAAAASGGQVQYRSIKMSDNGVSGGAITSGVGSGTNVTYRVQFRAATSYTIHGVVVDFCAGTGGTPFIGDSTCAAPTSFTVGATPTIDTAEYDYSSPTITVAGLEQSAGSSDWAATSINSGQTIKLTSSAGKALTAGTDYTFAFSGVTNTSTLGTFYARLITYTSATGDIATYDHGTPGNYQDYGGFALSTANIVQITAKVQETLTFCVSGTTDTTAYPNTLLTPPTTCATAVPAAIILGHGQNDTLDSSQIDKNTVWTLASTNALQGLTIRMHNSNICGGLSTDNGTTCAIPAIGSGASTPSAFVTGPPAVAGFGMYCYNSTGGTGSIGCDSNYHDSDVTHFGMDNTTTADNVSSTFGDIVAASTAPINSVTNQYDFAAIASNTTPAGIYKANMSMIATGTF